MVQMRIDGSSEPEKKSKYQRLKELLLGRVGINEDGEIDYDVKFQEGLRTGLFSLEEIIPTYKRSCIAELRRVRRKIHNKDGTPSIIPSATKPGVDVLLDFAHESDRWLNVLRRGLQTFGHHWRWKASAKNMEGRGEESLPVAEFQDGYLAVKAQYQLEAANLGVDPEGEEDEIGDQPDDPDDLDEPGHLR